MIHIGIDIGSVSIKIAVTGSAGESAIFKRIAALENDYYIAENGISDRCLMLSKYRRIMGEPDQMMLEMLGRLVRLLPAESILDIRFTGKGGEAIAKSLNFGYENQFTSLAIGTGALYPEAGTIIEMGGNSSKYLRISADGESDVRILDYEINGDCAGGTGAFMDQQASRLQYTVEEIGDVVLGATSSPVIAGRCTVFSKTDMVHAQQRGYSPAQILKGLCEAVVRNFKGTVVKGKSMVSPVIVTGGMAANSGIIQAVIDIFGLEAGDVIVPPTHAWMGAIGASLAGSRSLAKSSTRIEVSDILGRLDRMVAAKEVCHESSPPLTRENLVVLRDRADSYSFEGVRTPVRAYLGIDIGSVSTNLAVLDESGAMIHSVYLRTNSRPIEAVGTGLEAIREAVGERVTIVGVGTTGSGRELIGSLAGADVVYDEITAHKTGAIFVARSLLQSDVDTIFEIGGQDAKFIRLDNGVVVDFSMNEACSAGTGSFLEEQAERLGIRIEQEFASMAFESRAPVRLGERCTVFMEQDLITHLQAGINKSDLVAGLAYSVAFNYLNRVVRGRKIGDRVFFQGGTAYNDAVAAAFSSILNKTIVIPPHNGVMGAIGAALLARKRMQHRGEESRFRGYNLKEVKCEVREIPCHGCSNNCIVQQITIGDERTYWGDKCSNRFPQRAKTERRAVVRDLFSYRDRMLLGEEGESSCGIRIGIPRCMYFHDQYPFWRTYFENIGVSIVLSEATNRVMIEKGIESAMAEPCFPIQVAHGHVHSMMKLDLDHIFVPNVIDIPSPWVEANSYLCPWGQTLPFVLASARAISGIRERLLIPTIRFRDGERQVQRALSAMAAEMGVSRKLSDRAAEKAFRAQREFSANLVEAGKDALRDLRKHGREGIVMIGRPYTLYDPGSNQDIPRKLRDMFGMDLIPMDFLPLDSVDIRDSHNNMFWNYGRRILQTMRLVQKHPDLHVVYLSNFKCGPDSFIHHFAGGISTKPYLVLQIDGHGSDAGAMTRCEAYLESKGLL